MDKTIFKLKETYSDLQAPKILPPSEKLREEIFKILRNNESKLSILQQILKTVLKKYDVTGYAVYSELMDMKGEGTIEIQNGKLNNDSIIRIK